MRQNTKPLLDAVKLRKFTIEEATAIILSASAPESWKDDKKIIKVASNGRTGREWLEKLRSWGWVVDGYAISLLLSSDFKPTRGITSRIEISKFMNGDDIGDVQKEAMRIGLKNPSPETICLICEYFSVKELNERALLNLIVMHDPIVPSEGYGLAGNLCFAVNQSGDSKIMTAFSLSVRNKLIGWNYAYECAE